MVKWGRLIGAGIAVAIIRYIVSNGFGYAFQDLYDPTSGLWRAMTPSWFTNVAITHIILAFIAVIVYVLINKGLAKKAEVGKKGLKFGLVLWLLRDVTGSIMTLVFMPVSYVLILTWLFSGLVLSLINGQVIARIYK